MLRALSVALITAATLVASGALAGSGSAQLSDADKEMLTGVISENLLPYTTVEGPPRYALSAGTDAYGKVAGLTVYPNQSPKNGMVSSEIAISYPYKEGETMRYSWRMKIPNGFVPDTPRNRWWLVARWNDQANPLLGERPEQFLGHNPAMMIGYKDIGGKDVLTFSYGIPEALAAGSFNVTRNGWVKFAVEVTWTRGLKGKARVFVNDSKQPFYEVTGKNMYSKNYNVFRLGIARSTEIQTPAALHFSDVKIEKIADAPQ